MSPRSPPEHPGTESATSLLSSMSAALGGGVLGPGDSFGAHPFRSRGGVAESGDGRSPIQPPPAPAPPPREAPRNSDDMRAPRRGPADARTGMPEPQSAEPGAKARGREVKLERLPLHGRHLRVVVEGGRETVSGNCHLASELVSGSSPYERGERAGRDGDEGVRRGEREGRRKHFQAELTSVAERRRKTGDAERGGVGGRGSVGVSSERKHVFLFESEDESSTMDYSEYHEGEGAKRAPSRYEKGGDGDASRRGDFEAFAVSGTARGSSRGSTRTGTCTPPSTTKPERYWPSSSRNAFGANSGGVGNLSIASTLESASPDRMTAPRSPSTPASCGSSSPCTSETSASGRPLSAEKRQFLMKVRAAAVHGNAHGFL